MSRTSTQCQFLERYHAVLERKVVLSRKNLIRSMAVSLRLQLLAGHTAGAALARKEMV